MVEGMGGDADFKRAGEAVMLPLFDKIDGVLDDLRGEVFGCPHLILGVGGLEDEEDRYEHGD
jgi:hypothetical protein